MRNNSSSAMGAFHPILFFTLVYGISLLMAFLVCTAIYNSISGDEDVADQEAKPSKNVNFSTSDISPESTTYR